MCVRSFVFCWEPAVALASLVCVKKANECHKDSFKLDIIWPITDHRYVETNE